MNVYINYEKKFAFVEFRTVEETSNAMALDGIMFEGVSVRLPPSHPCEALVALLFRGVSVRLPPLLTCAKPSWRSCCVSILGCRSGVGEILLVWH